MNFGRSSFVSTNDTPRFDMLGDAVGAGKVLRGRADMMAGARRDAAQRFADARIAAAKQGMQTQQSQAAGIQQQGFMNAGLSAISGGLRGGFSEGGIFNRTPTPNPDTSTNVDFAYNGDLPSFSDSSYNFSSFDKYPNLFTFNR